MTLTQLRYLIAIVDAGMKITLAAKRLNATQPGLSKQLKQLEEQLQLTLFVRRGRSLEKLTPAGAEIVERARSLIGQADNIRTFAANQRAGGGSLTIETTHIQAQFVLPQAIATFRKRFPNIDVVLGFAADEDDPSRRNPDADFLMFSTDGEQPAAGAAIPLYQWDNVAIVPADHPLARDNRKITLARLAAYPLVSYDTSHAAKLSVAHTFTQAGLSPRFAYTVRDAGVIKAAVRDGIGIGLLAEMAADPNVDIDLHIIPLAGLLPRCTAWAVPRSDRILRDYVADLLSSLSGLTPLRIQRVLSGELQSDQLPEIPLWPDLRAKIEREVQVGEAEAA